MKSRFLGILSLLVLVLALTACDGSSGSSSSSSSSGASGAVVAAPLTNAKVYGYTAAGSSIEIGKTDSTGAIVFNSSLSKVNFPSIVYSNEGTNFESGKPFTGTLKGIMQSATSAVYLTPATTLIAELVDAGMPVAQAEQRVLNILKKEMGLTKASPLANPLSDLNNSEIVAQTLMFILNTTEESADGMGADIKNIAKLMMKDGSSFRDAVKSKVANSPLNDVAAAAKSIAEVIKANKETIVANATNALGSKAVKSELEVDVANDTDTTFAVALAASSTDFADVLPAPKAADTTFTLKTSVLSNKLIPAGQPNAGKTAPYSDETVAVVVKPAYGEVVLSPNTAVYTVTAAQIEGVTLPIQITFVLAANADASLQSTVSFTLEGDTSLAVKKLGFDGNGLYEFATPEEGKIVEKASKTLEAADFIAQFELVNKFVNNMSDNVDVKFTAPAGFKFSYNDGAADVNTDSFLVKTVSDDFKAVVAPGTKLVATKEVTPGYKPVGMQVIDEKTGAVLKTASDNLIFIPEGTKQQVTRLSLGASTANAEKNTRTISVGAVNLDSSNVYNVIDPKANVATLKLVGAFSTWEKEALTDDDTGDVSAHTSPTVDELYTKGAFYVVTTSKTAKFVVGAEEANNMAIAQSAVTFDKYNVTVDLKDAASPLKYKSAESSADTLKLMYVPNKGNGNTKVSQGGLELNVKLP